MIENSTFRLAPGVDEATFRAEDARVQQEIAYRHAGLQRRTTARADHGEWLVTTIWASEAQADAASDILDALLHLIDASTLRTVRYHQLD